MAPSLSPSLCFPSSASSHSLLLLLLLVALCRPTHAGFTDLDQTVVPQLDIIYQRVGMFATGDAPFGDPGTAYGKFTMEWSFSPPQHDRERTVESNLVGGEILLVHHSDWKDVGIDHLKKREYCCTQELLEEGLCTKQHNLIFQNYSYYSQLAYNAYSLQDGTQNRAITFDVEVTGVYYLVFGNCREDTDLMVTGILEWKNPYGYLEADIYGLFFAYWVVFVLYLPLAIWYFFSLMRFYSTSLGLQKFVMALLIIALVEQLIWGCDYDVYNKNGLVNDSANGVGTFFTSLRDTALRLVLLLVGLGYSVTKPVLRKRLILLIAVMSVFFFLASAISGYIEVARSAGAFVDENSIIFFEGVLIIANAIFFTWIAIALALQMRELIQKKEVVKLALYRNLAYCLIAGLVVGVIFYAIEFGLVLAEMRDAYFRIWWLWAVAWEVVYFSAALAIAFLWRPQENMSRYAYSSEIPTEDLDEAAKQSSDDGAEASADVSLDGLSGGDSASASA
eukprot:TRINITY_DN180_c0_g3_i1.p1 TRINITY_DN180_c0_g3~~TRINITY_DN180_c0_g3_i1.p1  ORF type:complete len:533 (-),score=71.66 TRINITY_DN180_c0_g3_i1:79-1596(-)